VEYLIVIILIFILYKIKSNRPKETKWTKEDEKREEEREKLIIEKIESLNMSIIDEINKYFIIPSCSRCLSESFLLIQMGLLGNSFKITCKTCGSKKWVKTKSEERDLTFLHSWFEDLAKLEKDIPFTSDIELSANKEGNVESNDIAYLRKPIPKDVQDRVWNRDGGKCVQCGSSEKLEFDHIIPISKGGSNTYRNIQLLCEICNRLKSNIIG
jgi:5-methylcytosine-specific restriction endonuclease McrA